ncbi:MAG: hypothetical protein IH788_00585 [Nitrospinae bacterium]|nr:hypothetical protein [Nitrospinota bacterium]
MMLLKVTDDNPLSRLIFFHMREKGVHITGGLILIAVGLLLITNYFTILNAYALKLTPKWLIQYL